MCCWMIKLEDFAFIFAVLLPSETWLFVQCGAGYFAYIWNDADLTLDLSWSSRTQMGALGTLTPFCSVCRQFFDFIPGDVHVLQISSDDVHPVFLWPSRLSLVAPQLPLYSLTTVTRYSGVLHSQYVSKPPQSSFLMMSSNFQNPVFLLISSFLTLSGNGFISIFSPKYHHDSGSSKINFPIRVDLYFDVFVQYNIINHNKIITLPTCSSGICSKWS